MTALLVLMLVLQQTPAPAAPAAQTPPATGAPATPAPARRPPPVSTSTSVQVRVTDRSGAPQQGAHVAAEGPVSREGETDTSGNVQLKNVTAGTYRIRASRDSFVVLEKEVVVRTGATTSPVDFALSSAPPPPAPVAPPPPPAPAPQPQPAVPTASAGEPRILSVADLAERSLTGRDAVRNVPVGCSGLDATQLVVLRETLNSAARAEADQMLYVVAGEGTLNLAGRDQALSSGWFALVPRGTPFTLTRKGRNPVIVLQTTGGQPCSTLNAQNK